MKVPHKVLEVLVDRVEHPVSVNLSLHLTKTCVGRVRLGHPAGGRSHTFHKHSIVEVVSVRSL